MRYELQQCWRMPTCSLTWTIMMLGNNSLVYKPKCQKPPKERRLLIGTETVILYVLVADHHADLLKALSQE